MEQKICIIDLDFIVGFAFIDLVSNYGRTAISEYRVEKYLNQIISSLNMYFKDVQFLPGFLDKSKIKNDLDSYLEDLEFHLAGWNLDLGYLAHLLAQKPLSYGRADRDLELAEVGLAFAHDGVGHLGLVSQILDSNLVHNLHHIGLYLAGVYEP